MVKIIINVEGDTKKHKDNKPKNIDNNTNDYDCHRIDVVTENSCMEEIDTNIGEDLQQVDKAVVIVCTSIKKKLHFFFASNKKPTLEAEARLS